jgi:integrase
MGLELRKGRGGKLRPTWYGRLFTVEGKGRVVNLKIKWAGTPPPTLREKGDDKFEASRDAAMTRYKELQSKAEEKETSAYHTKKLIQIQTGKKVEYVRVADLAKHWRKLSRETMPSEGWLGYCDTVFKRFAEATPVTFLHEVTADHATTYCESLQKNYTRKTAIGVVGLLKSAFARLLPTGLSNPFEIRISRKGSAQTTGDTIHRRPLTTAELKLLFEAARPDPLLYPLTVCAACTGMRIGDVCLLQRSSVDLEAGVVAVKTAKTGASVEIPIFEPLRDVLVSALAENKDSPYVWPKAAQLYNSNRNGITYRGKALFAKALSKAEKKPEGAVETKKAPKKKFDLVKHLPAIMNSVREAGITDAKRDRILDSLSRVARGQSYRQIEKETGRRRAIVSQDLKDAEDISGFTFRKGATPQSGRDIKTLMAATRQTRGKNGKDGKGGKMRAASLLGWHSLRGTFATLALSVGIPIETVKLVTGHGTVATITKFYYNPQREHLREVLGDKLPEVLTGKKAIKKPEQQRSQVKQLAAQIKGLTKADRAKLAKLIGGK